MRKFRLRDCFLSSCTVPNKKQNPYTILKKNRVLDCFIELKYTYKQTEIKCYESVITEMCLKNKVQPSATQHILNDFLGNFAVGEWWRINRFKSEAIIPNNCTEIVLLWLSDLSLLKINFLFKWSFLAGASRTPVWRLHAHVQPFTTGDSPATSREGPATRAD